MEDINSNAVNMADASVTESAPVEQATEDTSIESPEKALISEEVEQGTEAKPETKVIPY